MRKMNPLEKYLLGNVVGFSCLLLASANEHYQWVSLWYSILVYATGMITFLYVFFVALPQVKRWTEYKLNKVLPPARKK